MGDRSVVAFAFYPESPPLYLYSHWGGQSFQRKQLAEALAFGMPRWGDDEYLARVIITRIYSDLIGTVGGGVSTRPINGDYPLVVADLFRSQVYLGPDDGLVIGEEKAPRNPDKALKKGYRVQSFVEFLAEFLPQGLCGDRKDHNPHLVRKKLGSYWCGADQTQRLPYRLEQEKGQP